jgi:hypothetical protein
VVRCYKIKLNPDVFLAFRLKALTVLKTADHGGHDLSTNPPFLTLTLTTTTAYYYYIRLFYAYKTTHYQSIIYRYQHHEGTTEEISIFPLHLMLVPLNM